MSELAEALAEHESDDDTYTTQDRKRMYVALYQNHLPKMDDVGIVEYNSRSGHVRLTPAFGQIEPYLYDRQNSSIRWHHVYLSAGLLGVGIGVSGYLWSSIPAVGWFGMLAGIVCFLIAGHLVLSTNRPQT